MSLPEFKVIISDGGYDMVLDVSPDSFSESRTANWSPYDVVHTPVQVLGYSGTTSRNISITAKLISRTAKEAKINKNRIQTVRFWVVNDFGVGNTGAPPPVLRLKAFKNTFPEMQCYMTSYSTDYPSDVDWIETTEGDPFPTVITVSLSFIEVYAPAQLRFFNRLNLKGANFKSEHVGFGKGGCGIGGIGSGSSLSKVIDDKAFDGVSGVSGNFSKSAESEIGAIVKSTNDGMNGSKESFSEALQKAKEKNSIIPGSDYSKAQLAVMSNNFSILPSAKEAGLVDNVCMSDKAEQYRQQLKSPLYANLSLSTGSKVNTKMEDISALI